MRDERTAIFKSMRFHAINFMYSSYVYSKMDIIGDTVLKVEGKKNQGIFCKFGSVFVSVDSYYRSV